MNGSKYLNTIAGVSVTFVGFAAITLAIRHRSQEIIGSRKMIAVMVERGLSALGFALLPSLLYYFGMPAETSFRLCSAILAIYLLTAFVRLYRIFFAPETSADVSSTGGVSRLVFMGLMIPVQVLAALEVLPLEPLGLYLLGVSWLLIMAGGVFVGILTRAI